MKKKFVIMLVFIINQQLFAQQIMVLPLDTKTPINTNVGINSNVGINTNSLPTNIDCKDCETLQQVLDTAQWLTYNFPFKTSLECKDCDFLRQIVKWWIVAHSSKLIDYWNEHNKLVYFLFQTHLISQFVATTWDNDALIQRGGTCKVILDSGIYNFSGYNYIGNRIDDFLNYYSAVGYNANSIDTADPAIKKAEITYYEDARKQLQQELRDPIWALNHIKEIGTFISCDDLPARPKNFDLCNADSLDRYKSTAGNNNIENYMRDITICLGKSSEEEIDVLYLVDKIYSEKLANKKYKVFVHVLGYNTMTKTLILDYTTKGTIVNDDPNVTNEIDAMKYAKFDIKADFDSVKTKYNRLKKMMLTTSYKKDVDCTDPLFYNLFYDTTRYMMEYLPEPYYQLTTKGWEFNLKICDVCYNDDEDIIDSLKNNLDLNSCHNIDITASPTWNNEGGKVIGIILKCNTNIANLDKLTSVIRKSLPKAMKNLNSKVIRGSGDFYIKQKTNKIIK
jgi:hypothetical protein